MPNVWTEFAQNTTAHGVGRAVTERSRWVRVVWGLVFMVTLGVCISQIYFLVVTYKARPVTIERKVNTIDVLKMM